jgi:GNAT superfamily N-acetyltransferase
MVEIRLRDYQSSDAENLNRIAVSAFDQFRDRYDDWPAMRAGLSKTSALGVSGEVIIAELQTAELQNKIAGAVAYFGPNTQKAAFFDQRWPIIRMLVVDPAFRGKGIGRALSDACIARARREGSPIIALHTSPIMSVALPMYLKMGFVKAHDAPPIFGVVYAVYTKAL